MSFFFFEEQRTTPQTRAPLLASGLVGDEGPAPIRRRRVEQLEARLRRQLAFGGARDARERRAPGADLMLSTLAIT